MNELPSSINCTHCLIIYDQATILKQTVSFLVLETTETQPTRWITYQRLYTVLMFRWRWTSAWGGVTSVSQEIQWACFGGEGGVTKYLRFSTDGHRNSLQLTLVSKFVHVTGFILQRRNIFIVSRCRPLTLKRTAWDSNIDHEARSLWHHSAAKCM
jgi:hypothetical protein